jgi:hypothetical protein
MTAPRVPISSHGDGDDLSLRFRTEMFVEENIEGGHSQAEMLRMIARMMCGGIACLDQRSRDAVVRPTLDRRVGRC